MLLRRTNRQARCTKGRLDQSIWQLFPSPLQRTRIQISATCDSKQPGFGLDAHSQRDVVGLGLLKTFRQQILIKARGSIGEDPDPKHTISLIPGYGQHGELVDPCPPGPYPRPPLSRATRVASAYKPNLAFKTGSFPHPTGSSQNGSLARSAFNRPWPTERAPNVLYPHRFPRHLVQALPNPSIIPAMLVRNPLRPLKNLHLPPPHIEQIQVLRVRATANLTFGGCLW